VGGHLAAYPLSAAPFQGRAGAAASAPAPRFGTDVPLFSAAFSVYFFLLLLCWIFRQDYRSNFRFLPGLMLLSNNSTGTASEQHQNSGVFGRHSAGPSVHISSHVKEPSVTLRVSPIVVLRHSAQLLNQRCLIDCHAAKPSPSA